MMEVLIGFLIAAVVGLTGIGGGTFTTPALVLLIGLPAGESVGTAMVFAAVLRLIAAPFYLVRKQVHGKYLWPLLLGAVPGLLFGTWLLHRMGTNSNSPLVLVGVGVMLAFSSAITFAPRLQNPKFARDKRRWLSLVAFPIGIETGFSSAGAGALGSILLLNFSELSAVQVVGTDLLFGIVLAVVGSAFHLGWGSINGETLVHLLMGGVPGVLVGCAAAPHLSGNKLRTAVALVGIALGLQMAFLGGKTLVERHDAANLQALRRVR
jgi:uncharacterized membrane protein YfcA